MFAVMVKQVILLDSQAWFSDEERRHRLRLERHWPNGFVCRKISFTLKGRMHNRPVMSLKK